MAMECPVCGLSLVPQAPPRPLLFQASALQEEGSPAPRRQAISSPALGRVTPVELPPEPALPLLAPEGPTAGPALPASAPAAAPADPGSSLWPLVKLEGSEAILLLLLNLALVLTVGWLPGAGLVRAYGELWMWLLPFHLAASWTLFLVPLLLAGQSPLMGRFGLILDSAQPERRLAFSLFHLLSVSLFPVSFLCLVLTREHRTLAELLTGQELLQRSPSRMR